MSEFKFACPVCGQHITCDSAKSGTQLDCPTCFQKLIVPRAPEGDASKLILNAALVRSARPLPPNGVMGEVTVHARPSASKLPLMAMTGIALVCAAIAFFAIRDKYFKPTQSAAATNPKHASSSPAVSATSDAHWTLNLANVAIPATPAAGRINGRVFHPPQVTFQGDALNFRQGAKQPPDLGLMIVFTAKGVRDLAGKSFNFETNSDQSPKGVLRWKDEQGQSQRTNYHSGYALRLEFGPLSGNRLTGKLYFCAPDETKSYVAGTFDAEILKPSPPKPNVPKKLKRVR